MPKKFVGFTFACALTLLGAPASAAEIFFAENLSPRAAVSGTPLEARAAFLAELSGTSTVSFDDLTKTPTSLTFTGSAGTITGTFARDGVSLGAGTNATGRFPTSGGRYLAVGSDGSFQINFDQAIAAIGFYGTDIGDFAGQLSIELLRAGSFEAITVPHTREANNGSLLFFGLTDRTNPFTGVRFVSNSAGAVDNFGIDDITIGDPQQVISAVPEPATWATLIVGLGLVGASMRRRAGSRRCEA